MSDKKHIITEKDFVLVQQDQKIHDLKFETKPTTYFKDAMRRFVKNKSSVVAGVIIGILILLALFVPIFNKNDIKKSQVDFRFLPPRWPGFDNASVLNGRRYVKNIVYDNTDPDPQNHHPVGYDKEAIVGEIALSEGTTNLPSKYASGGKLIIMADRSSFATGIQTNFVRANFADNVYYLELETDTVINSNNNFEIYMLVYYYGLNSDASQIILQPMGSTYGVFTADLSAAVINNRPEGVVANQFFVQIGVYVAATNSPTGERAQLCINKLVVTTEGANNPFELHNFTEANELLLRRSDDDKRAYRYQTVIAGNQILYEAKVLRASFEYDYYKAVYGEVARRIGISELLRARDEGKIAFDLDPAASDHTSENFNYQIVVDTFEVLDDKKSQYREIKFAYGPQKVSAGTRTIWVFNYEVVISRYREMGYTKEPYFLFGTNQRGQDFFKIVFNGLRTSLLLGFSAAAINIFIGLVWGAISGYYGGTIDILMERFTEILGGVPWIIIMTLTILHLGNNFGVFLLALIMTGWIGTAAVTRSQFYRYKRREYVLASRTLGAKDSRLIFKHILPNSIGPIVTGAVMMIPGIIFSEATISYLGLGLKGLTSLGVSLSEVQEYIATSPYLIVSGSLVIALLMISFNLFGNGLRDAFNPSLKGVE
ncbi:MAG: ABC transporter permease [Bacilli bacterium]|jgi:oligopeptide transport system permease protein